MARVRLIQGQSPLVAPFYFVDTAPPVSGPPDGNPPYPVYAWLFDKESLNTTWPTEVVLDYFAAWCFRIRRYKVSVSANYSASYSGTTSHGATTTLTRSQTFTGENTIDRQRLSGSPGWVDFDNEYNYEKQFIAQAQDWDGTAVGTSSVAYDPDIFGWNGDTSTDASISVESSDTPTIYQDCLVIGLSVSGLSNDLDLNTDPGVGGTVVGSFEIKWHLQGGGMYTMTFPLYSTWVAAGTESAEDGTPMSLTASSITASVTLQEVEAFPYGVDPGAPFDLTNDNRIWNSDGTLAVPSFMDAFSSDLLTP